MKKEFNILAAAQFQKERAQRIKQERERLLAKARTDFDAIIKMIIERYRPTAIYQWGSLIDGKHFTERSDIDIAVTGIESAETFFALAGEAMHMTEFPLDILQLEKIAPEFRQQILTTGRKVYGHN